MSPITPAQVLPITPDRTIIGTFKEIFQEDAVTKLTVDDFLESDLGQRQIFNVFFASNAMALRRIELEIEPIPELKD